MLRHLRRHVSVLRWWRRRARCCRFGAIGGSTGLHLSVADAQVLTVAESTRGETCGDLGKLPVSIPPSGG